MSVFQDVTAVPFLVVIPVLGVAASAEMLAGALTWAMANAEGPAGSSMDCAPEQPVSTTHAITSNHARATGPTMGA
jgi:hypothetical protein